MATSENGRPVAISCAVNGVANSGAICCAHVIAIGCAKHRCAVAGAERLAFDIAFGCTVLSISDSRSDGVAIGIAFSVAIARAEHSVTKCGANAGTFTDAKHGGSDCGAYNSGPYAGRKHIQPNGIAFYDGANIITVCCTIDSVAHSIADSCANTVAISRAFDHITHGSAIFGAY